MAKVFNIPTVTIEDAINGAHDLLHGDKTPSLKLALWGAAMSSMQEIGKNGLQTRILARYVNAPLPERPELVEALRAAKGNINRTHLMALYRIQDLANEGILDGLTEIGDTFEEQAAWRDKMWELLTGKGMSWKTVSFAALIYNPLPCQLVPVDRHVLHRLGYTTDSSPRARSVYTRIENEVRLERDAAGYTDLPLAQWHWYKWEEYRQVMGLSKTNEGVESHRNMSCRWY